MSLPEPQVNKPRYSVYRTLTGAVCGLLFGWVVGLFVCFFGTLASSFAREISTWLGGGVWETVAGIAAVGLVIFLLVGFMSFEGEGPRFRPVLWLLLGTMGFVTIFVVPGVSWEWKKGLTFANQLYPPIVVILVMVGAAIGIGKESTQEETFTPPQTAGWLERCKQTRLGRVVWVSGCTILGGMGGGVCGLIICVCAFAAFSGGFGGTSTVTLGERELVILGLAGFSTMGIGLVLGTTAACVGGRTERAIYSLLLGAFLGWLSANSFLAYLELISTGSFSVESFPMLSRAIGVYDSSLQVGSATHAILLLGGLLLGMVSLVLVSLLPRHKGAVKKGHPANLS